MDKKIYSDGQSNNFTDILMNTGMTYTIVGAFFYIPGLILLNLVSFLISRLKTKWVKWKHTAWQSSWHYRSDFFRVQTRPTKKKITKQKLTKD